MKILSLFDGCSCGQQALKELGFNITEYYASEIDKYAIQVTQKNHQNTIQIGDVTKVSYKNGILTTENGEFDVGDIDLVMGGSPCQGFSFAGKQLNFGDPRSALFFEFTRILKECNPKYFLLENVMMKKESVEVITGMVGVEPVEVNSALVSGQFRKRLYWSNIPNFEIPKDRGILLKDVLENEYDESVVKLYDKHIKTSPSRKNSLGCIEVGHARLNGHDFLKRVYSPEGKCPTLTAVCGGNQERKVMIDDNRWRKLTPLEYERLQTLPDNYTDGVSKTQRYKMIGNGWSIETIKCFFKNLGENEDETVLGRIS